MSLPTTHILIAGLSTRAAAESAAHAGFAVTTIDAFADLDQHASVASHLLPRSFSARAAARASQDVACDAVAYLSNFENHPVAVRTLAAGRQLWGNPPDVLRRVRNPLLLTRALVSRGLAAPAVMRADDNRAVPDSNEGTLAKDTVNPSLPDTDSGQWLMKPLASGGGHRVQHWRPGMDLPRGSYLQELVDGTPGSAVFVAAGGRAVLLGISHQLIGDEAFGTTGYRYCGNILAPTDDLDAAGDAPVEAAAALVRAVAGEFKLVGVNGIDFIVRDEVPYAIEVNPRWSASMELIERAYGLSVFGTHAVACAAGDLPAFDLASRRRGKEAVGKAVVFARWDVEVGDTRAWLGDASVRDVPRPGQRIALGRPVCTVFATGRDEAACHAALVARAERVYAALALWARGAA